MHPLATDMIVKQVFQRRDEGDCPSIPAKPAGVLEDVIIDLASRLQAGRSGNYEDRHNGPMVMHPISNMKDMSGPIGIISGEAIPSFHLENTPVWLQLAVTVYIFSMGVGGFNLIPLSFLDGGRIFENLFSRFPKFLGFWRATTGVVLVSLLVCILVTDIMKIIARF